MKTLEERKAILENEIIRQQRKAWQVLNRMDTSCQMTIKKKIDVGLLIVLILLFLPAAILYLIFRKKMYVVYLEINSEGELKYTSKDMDQHLINVANKQANEEAKKVNYQPPVSNQPTNDLGLLSTVTIASGLNMSEQEVINLIESGQLKGKKIGDKYFVRKEDFDAFMAK